ncbi:MAG: RecX family transcriptional regulator [Coriobacteriia bacterium]|nr:RecX family transcriptional regulator [Coriobacteriia bacterium]
MALNTDVGKKQRRQSLLSADQAAENKALRLIAARERSSHELTGRLLSAGFGQDIVRALVKRFVDAGIVDDGRFCRLYIVSKRNQGWGMYRITKALNQFGIDAHDYPDLIDEFTDEDDELERAVQALSRYRGRARDEYSGRYRYLVTKGFSAAVVREAMKEWRQVL